MNCTTRNFLLAGLLTFVCACDPAYIFDGKTQTEDTGAQDDTATTQDTEDSAVEDNDNDSKVGPDVVLPGDKDSEENDTAEPDADDDGSPDDVDCDDNDDDIYPGATEICDSEDNDCDSVVDEDCASGTSYTYYRDSDGDSYGDPAVTTTATSTPTGYVSNSTDCDDTDANTHPGASETCDGEDDDCDDSIDEGVTTTYYADTDGDSYGNATSTKAACSLPSGYVTNDDDCNDSTSSAHPGAIETCSDSIDNDCDGDTNEGCTGSTTDDDGDGYTEASGDCDDTDSSTHPGATETCDGEDDDCDDSIDEGVINTYYRDADSDSYGVSTTTTSACSAPTGYVSNSTDCDDTDNGVHPGATETCDSEDDDCDGSVDEGVTTTYYRDADSDSYGTSSTTTAACSLPTGYVTNSTDCNDSSASVHPGATEADNDIDDDCDGTTDEGFSGSTSDEDCDGQLACFVNNDSDSYADVLYVSVSLFTAGSTYQTHDAVVVGIGSSWDMNDDNVAVIEDGEWFVIDPGTWSCGVEHDITLVSSIDNDGVDMFDQYDCDTDEDIETSACDGVVSYTTWSPEAVWLQNYSFCTGSSTIAHQICELQSGTSYLFSLEVDCSTREFRAD
ncbi:MAG: MopE-related protein [Patescibacteria group bacterium]